ncbi:MAG: V-type ATPase subunit [Candidatus Binatia bacterium]
MKRDLHRYAAANARVRTLIPKLLGRVGLEALYGYPSRDAMLDILLRTPYGGTLGKPPSESSLRGRLIEIGRTLLHLLGSTEAALVKQYLLRHELENLKIVVRAVCRRLPLETVRPYLLVLGDISTLDMQRLVDARDLQELTDRLETTAYAAPMATALHRIEDAGPFALEVALEIDYYERLWQAAGALESSDAKRAHGLLGILFDILNLVWIARYRDALGMSPEEILNYTLRQGRWVTFALRRALAEGPELSWGVVLERTPYTRPLAEADTRGFDACSPALWRVLAAEAHRQFRGYPFHIGVPLAFLLTQELEIRDLQILLAAKMIGLPTAAAFEHVATIRH